MEKFKFIGQIPPEADLQPGDEVKVRKGTAGSYRWEEYKVASDGSVYPSSMTEEEWLKLGSIATSDIAKLQGLNTQAQLDSKINTMGSNAAGSIIEVPTNLVLPRGSSVPSYITGKGKALLRGGDTTSNTYTNTGTTPNTIVVSAGSIRDAFYDRATDTWTAGLEQKLPTQSGTVVLNPTGTGLPQEQAVAVYVQPLFDTINILEETVDELTESKSALVIDNTTPTIMSDVTLNPKMEILVTATNGNVLSGDFSVWGSSKFFPATVKYTDGTYENVLILSFTSTSAVASNNFSKSVERISNLHDVNLGQHLSDLGYKEMGYRLYNSDYRHSFRHTLVKGINMATHAISAGVITDTSTGKQVLSLRTLNSYPANYTGIGAISVSYSEINTPRMNMYPTNVIGRGIEFDFDSSYNGFFEIFVGSRITGTQNINGVAEPLVGGVQVQFINKSTSAVVYEKYVKGEAKRIIFDHGRGTYTVKIFVPVAEYTSGIVSQMYWWKKRIVNPAKTIFSKADRVLFLTDSWGMYPQETDPNFQVQMFDGYKINGRCYMPLEFKSQFVANGGDPNNVVLATRGGMTTVWAKYWIDHIVNIVKPTKVVLHFGINDQNSISKHSNPENEYKFDPTNIWGTKNISDGGIVGSIPDIATYKANINELRSYCIAKGIIPVFFTPPKTASSAQAQGLSNIARDVFFSVSNF